VQIKGLHQYVHECAQLSLVVVSLIITKEEGIQCSAWVQSTEQHELNIHVYCFDKISILSVSKMVIMY